MFLRSCGINKKMTSNNAFQDNAIVQKAVKAVKAVKDVVVAKQKVAFIKTIIYIILGVIGIIIGMLLILGLLIWLLKGQGISTTSSFSDEPIQWRR